MATTATDAAAATKEQTTNSAGGVGEQKTRHSEVGHKSLLQSDALYQVPREKSIRLLLAGSRTPGC